ncbi:uncharacterized protein RHO17_019631 [Thomomys bottae]
MFLLPVMSPVCLWALKLLPTLLQLWLLVQPAPIAHWARNSVQLASLPSYLPTESPNILTPPADSRGPYNLGSSAPSKMSAPSQEMTDSLLPFLDSHSGQPSPKSKQFLIPHQDLPDKLIPQRLPEVVQVSSGDYKKAGPPPHPLKSKIQTIDLDQASDHQSFEILLASVNQSTKTTPFVSPGTKENDIAQPSRLATFIVGTEKQFVQPQLQKQPLQNYSDKSTNVVHFDNLSLKPKENTSKPSELLVQVKPSKFQLETQTPETPEKVSFSGSQRDTTAQHQLANERVIPSVPGGVKFSFSSRKETHFSAFPNALINPLNMEVTIPQTQQTNAQPPESDEEEKHSSTHEKGPVQPSDELHKDTEHAESQLEVPAHPEKASEEVTPPVQQEIPVQAPESLMEKIITNLPHREVRVQLSDDDQDYHDYFPNVTVKPLDAEVSMNSEPTKEAEHFIDQHEVPSQPLGSSVVAEPTSHHEEQTAQPSQSPGEDELSESYLVSSIQPSEFSEDLQSLNHHAGPYQTSGPVWLNKPHPSEQEQAAHSESPHEVESSGSHLEDNAEPEKPLEENTHPAEHETPAQAPESHMENVVETPEKVTKHPSQIQAHDDNLGGIKVKPEDKEVAITSEPTEAIETNVTKHNSSIKPHGLPVEADSPTSKEEQPGQHSESHGETEISGNDLKSSSHPLKVAEEDQLSLTQVEVLPKTLATETSLNEQEHPVQHSESSQKVEHSGSHLEDEARLEKYPEEVTPPVKQEAPIHASESPKESVAKTLTHDKMTIQPTDLYRYYHDYLTSINVKPENYHDNLGDFNIKPENYHENSGDFNVKPENYHDNSGDFNVKPENYHDNLGDFNVKPENYHDNLGDFNVKPENYHENSGDFNVKPENYHDNLGDFNVKPENYRDNLGDFNVKPENYHDNFNDFNVKPENYHDNLGDFNVKLENYHDNLNDFNVKPENYHDNSGNFNVKPENYHDNSGNFNIKPENYHDNSGNFNVKPENYHDNSGNFNVKPENYHDNSGDFNIKPENYHDNSGDFNVKPENYHDNLGDFNVKPENYHDNLGGFNVKPENYHDNLGDFNVKTENYHDNLGNFNVKPENYHDNLGNFNIKPENYHDNLGDFNVKPENYHDNLGNFEGKPGNYHDNVNDFKIKPENYHDNLGDFNVKPENYHDNLGDFNVKPENYHDNSGDFNVKPENYHDNLGDFNVKPENYHDNLGDFNVKPENYHENLYDFKGKPENYHDNSGGIKDKPENYHDNLGDFNVKSENYHYNLADLNIMPENYHDNLGDVNVRLENYHDNSGDFNIKPENYHDNLVDFKVKAENYHDNSGDFNVKPENYHDNSGGFNIKPENYHDNSGGFNIKSENYHDNSGGFNVKPENYHDNSGGFNVKPENYHDNSGDFNVKPENYHDNLDNFKVKPENYHDNLDNFKIKPENYHYNLEDFQGKPGNYHDNLNDFHIKPEIYHDNLDDFKDNPEHYLEKLEDFKGKPENYHENLNDLKDNPEHYHENLYDFKGKPENLDDFKGNTEHDHENSDNFKGNPENYHENEDNFKGKPEHNHKNLDHFKVKPKDMGVTVHSGPIKEIQAALVQHDTQSWLTENAQEVVHVLSEQKQTTHHFEYPQKKHPSEMHPETQAQASEHTEEFEPLIYQEQPAQFSEHHESIAPLPQPEEAQYSDFPSMTVEHPDVGFPIKPEPTTEIYYATPDYNAVPMNDRSSIAQPHEAPPLFPEISEEAEPIPIQEASSLEATGDGTLSTQQEAIAENVHTLEEIETPFIRQEAPTKLSDFPMEVELPSAENVALAQFPKPHIVHAPVHFEIISDQDQALPSVTVPHLDVEINITPEPTRESEHSSALKKPRVSLMKPEIPSPVPAQNPHPAQVTVQPFDLDLTLTPGSGMEIEPAPTIQDTITEHSTPLKGLMSQAVVFYVMPVSMPGHDRIHHTKPSKVPLPSLDLVLPSTSGSTAGTEYSSVLKPTTIVPPNQPKMTFQTPVTAHSLNVEFTITPHSVNSATENTLAVHLEQIAFPSTNICELCTCQFQALVCVGLNPKQRLHQVPVPDPTAKMKIFTSLNFHGNAISYTDENTWREYPWAEKLILSENHLTELRKDSFEGLLSVMVLDLSCNKIQSIERSTFEPLPFLKFLNLGCNLLTELSFGTFEAWHGMQFLHQLILSRNPLISVEDIHLFKLPALKYLDMGRTQVQLTTVENILTMTLELEKLILPHQIAGCLCQYKNNIEVVCKTVKLHCDSILLINITYCLEEESIGNPEGTFMKVLKVRKRNNSTELIIEPEREYLDKNDASYSGFMNEHIELNNENEISSALNNILPYLSQGNIYDARATLLPFIKLLLSNEKNGDNYMDNTKTNIGRPPVKPESNINNMNKLNILENLLNSEIKKRISEVRKKEDINVDTQPITHLGPKFKRQIFPQKVENVKPQKGIWEETEGTEKRLPRLNRVLRGPKSIQKRHFKKVNKQNIWMKQSGQPVVENIAKERFRRLPLRELHVSQKPRKLMGDSLPTEPSFTKGFKAAASSLLKPDPVGSRASTFTIEKPLDEVQNRAKTLSYTRFALDGVNSRVKSIKASNPILASPQNDDIHKTGSPVAHRIPKAKRNRKFRKKTLLFRPVHANRPPFSGARSLINSPSGEDFSSLGELNSQENTFPEFYAISNPSIDITLPKRQITTNAFVKNIPVLGGSLPKNTIHENFAAPGSSVTALNLMPPAQQTDETVWEHLGIDSSLKAIDSQSQFTSFGDHFEMQLNQQLKPLIPNNDVRKLLSQLIRALKMDCSESGMHAACTKLISRSGLLMKLLSKSQEVKLSKAEWDTDQWKTDNYINESTEVQGVPKQSSELIQEVPGYGFNNKIILAVAVVLVVMMLIIIFCLIEICCHRRATEEGKESTRGFFWFLRRQGSSESECQDGFFLGRPLWLRDMYRPLSATSKENMAKKLHDKDSSDEDEIFQKKEKKSSETAIEMPTPTSSTGTNAMEETENAGCCGMFPSKKN